MEKISKKQPWTEVLQIKMQHFHNVAKSKFEDLLELVNLC